MTDNGTSRREAFIVFMIVLCCSALLSGYLTFRVQFERKKEPPIEKPKAASFQTLQIKEQERKQLHEHYHLGAEDINLDAWANRSTCIVCHSPYPHGRNKQQMAIMNLHTEFLTCQSCHLKTVEAEQIRFDWINPPGFNPAGKPYGTVIDPQTGFFALTDNHVSKLTPLRNISNKWEPVLSEQGVDKALAYMREKDSYKEEKKKAVEDELHRGTELKEFVKCASCHSEKGLLPFKALGFDAARTNQLQKMEIGGMITNYDVFYFPDLFEKKFK